MKIYKLSSFERGWVCGNFNPTLINTNDFEIAIKHYVQGSSEESHVHKLDYEITIVISGQVKMNSFIFGDGDIVVIEPGESSDFTAITKVTTCVIRPSSAKLLFDKVDKTSTCGKQIVLSLKQDNKVLKWLRRIWLKYFC